MVRATCTQKFRDKHNAIKGYRLVDTNGRIKDVKSEALKQAIKDKKIEVVNLTLTSDDRLIYKEIVEEEMSPMEKIVLKFRLSGAEQIKTYCGHTVYMAIDSNRNAVLIIPDDVAEINRYNMYGQDIRLNFDNYSINTIRVYGGKGLKSANALLYNCVAMSIDISHLNLDRISDMSHMFEGVWTKTLDVSNLDTSRVKTMQNMFKGCTIPSLDLSNFSTERLADIKSMFEESKIEDLDISNFKLNRVTDIRDLFTQCDIRKIKLSNDRKLATAWCNQ